jgi:hypothetical protein
MISEMSEKIGQLKKTSSVDELRVFSIVSTPKGSARHENGGPVGQ